MYTCDPSGQSYSLQYESSTYLGGWYGVGRLISDRLTYRNHYMCSGEATSTSGSVTIGRVRVTAPLPLSKLGFDFIFYCGNTFLQC